MTQDHIKLRWLIEYLEQLDILSDYQWDAVVSMDESSSCIVQGGLYHVDLEYSIFLHIREYQRSSVELRRVILNWLDIANQQGHQHLETRYKVIDTDRYDILITLDVEEEQRDEICDEASADGYVNIDGVMTPVRLNRDKPDELVNLESISKNGVLCCPHLLSN